MSIIVDLSSIFELIFSNNSEYDGILISNLISNTLDILFTSALISFYFSQWNI